MTVSRGWPGAYGAHSMWLSCIWMVDAESEDWAGPPEDLEGGATMMPRPLLKPHRDVTSLLPFACEWHVTATFPG